MVMKLEEIFLLLTHSTNVPHLYPVGQLIFMRVECKPGGTVISFNYTGH